MICSYVRRESKRGVTQAGMPVSPYCASCWSRKQRPGARYCDNCAAQHTRKAARKWRGEKRGEVLADVRRLKAQEAAAYRSRTSVLSQD